MPRKMKIGYGATIDKRFFGWDIGIGLSSNGYSTCVYIGLFKWIIHIGQVLKPVESE